MARASATIAHKARNALRTQTGHLSDPRQYFNDAIVRLMREIVKCAKEQGEKKEPAAVSRWLKSIAYRKETAITESEAYAQHRSS